MASFTINSKKYGRPVTFYHWADDAEGKDSVLYANTNGYEGTRGNQCFSKGYYGSSLKVTEKNARRVAYDWLRKFF